MTATRSSEMTLAVFVDKVVGAFLRDPRLNPNSDWARLA
jgi:hypothetical protein